MSTHTDIQTKTLYQVVAGSISYCLTGFYTAKRITWKSDRTEHFYRDELGLFARFLENQGVIHLNELTPETIRLYLLSLRERRNPGGIHVAFRAIRSWLNWSWMEYEPDWKNPILKIEPPKLNNQPLPGLPEADFWRMVETCKDGRLDIRDRAVLMILFETGIRASELIALNVGDVNINQMFTIIRHGKGDKYRITPFQVTTKRAINRMLKIRADFQDGDPLFQTDEGGRLSFWGLREIIRRRALRAGIETPGLHDFRRATGRSLNDNGMGIYDISQILGHSSTKVTERYIRLEDKKLAEKFARTSPVEKSRKSRR